jgi:hypothetical protein
MTGQVRSGSGGDDVMRSCCVRGLISRILEGGSFEVVVFEVFERGVWVDPEERYVDSEK